MKKTCTHIFPLIYPSPPLPPSPSPSLPLQLLVMQNVWEYYLMMTLTGTVKVSVQVSKRVGRFSLYSTSPPPSPSLSPLPHHYPSSKVDRFSAKTLLPLQLTSSGVWTWFANSIPALGRFSRSTYVSLTQ